MIISQAVKLLETINKLLINQPVQRVVKAVHIALTGQEQVNFAPVYRIAEQIEISQRR